MTDQKDEAPYEPRHKGFDVEATKRAQATAQRAQDGAGAAGEDANRSYVDDGPEEAARRTGDTSERLGDAIEDAARKKRPT